MCIRDSDQSGVDDQAQRLRVDHLRFRQVRHRDSLRLVAEVTRSHEQRVVVRRSVFQNRIAELNPVLAEAICRAAVNVVVRGQQVHGRIIGVGIPAAAVALHLSLIHILRLNSTLVFTLVKSFGTLT